MCMHFIIQMAFGNCQAVTHFPLSGGEVRNMQIGQISNSVPNYTKKTESWYDSRVVIYGQQRRFLILQLGNETITELGTDRSLSNSCVEYNCERQMICHRNLKGHSCPIRRGTDHCDCICHAPLSEIKAKLKQKKFAKQN